MAAETVLFSEVCSTNFLGFEFGGRSYSDQLADAVRKTKKHCAVEVFRRSVKGVEVVYVQHDFGFLGGSLGCAEGEKVARAFEYGTAQGLPVVVACRTGGARMQEGTLSLMQMAKVSVAVEAHRRAGLPFVSVLEDPTYGGVSASYAMQADVKIAVSRARVGFAGPGVILNTMFDMNQARYDNDCPAEFQSAEFCLANGAVDVVVEQGDPLEATVANVAKALLRGAHGARSTPNVSFFEAAAAYAAPSEEEEKKMPDYTASRLMNRPQFADVRNLLFSDYVALAGDGQVGSDCCIEGGVAMTKGPDSVSCVVIGCRKGHSPGEMQKANYGMPAPAGYRTAKKLMKLAERFALPVITFVDTCGAWPSFPAEEAGQSEAIATNLTVMAGLKVPVVTVVLGEGGSGGALGIAMGNAVGMLSQAYYGVISPEGAASILGRYKDDDHKLKQFPKDCAALATAQSIYAYQLKELGVVDTVIYEDPDESYDNFPKTAARIAKFVQDSLKDLVAKKTDVVDKNGEKVGVVDLVAARYAKYRNLGKFVEMSPEERDTTVEAFLAAPSSRKARPPKNDYTPCKLVRYLATEVLHGERSRFMGLAPSKAPVETPPSPAATLPEPPKGQVTAKTVLDAEGPEAMAKWVRETAKTRVLVTDTTMRDAHQSLLATRVRTMDLVEGAKIAGKVLHSAFSFEMWGGATFDVSYRFLKEDPWERLREIRAACPNVCTQMLIRGANAVGYTSYPDNVVVEFVELAAKNGLDIFRIFDCFNDVDQMRVTIDAVRKVGKVAECCVCYTSDVLKSTIYDVAYYADLAKRLVEAGAHVIAIKDMAGLLKPSAAKPLLEAIRGQIPDDVPIHFHTHCTSSASLAAAIEMTRHGCDVVDFAVAAMADLTSQPSLNAFCAAMEGLPRGPDINYMALEPLDIYWMKVREMYAPFETGMLAGSARVYDHEIPGGQYANLFVQCKSMGLGDRWAEVLDAYRDVNRLFGDIVKVTPSSKCVGDLALFLINKNLHAADVLREGKVSDYPESVVGLMEGRLGFPHRGFPEEVASAILKGKPQLAERPSAALPPADFEKTKTELASKYGITEVTDELCSAALLYPKVFEDYVTFCQKKTAVAAAIPTPVFWYSFDVGQTCTITCPTPQKAKEELGGPFSRDDDDAKLDATITLKRVGPLKAGRMRTVVFDVDGAEQHVEVKQPAAEGEFDGPMADAADPTHVPSPMPGVVEKVNVALGQTVDASDELFVVSAMKMEVKVKPPAAGTVKQLLVNEGDKVIEGALLAVIA
mmetsp:Transcript_13785/g.44957  ORF Transcript_13785/g.44957 Transcript_13785/m.44957 type:complete len:1276 (-) Transcript_13785:333-4160(-)|eukprot:CAMPEP_0118907302 /NCGR_PEP_ID=MMETSP1166-20130328/10812_1 /TAXON_ID=1104430 /ORGANISM="Chrysoreinhardia sp, Strain CCMP3193" /LENGTH=1275 /DNA_ID=CAMNT_0006846665 /DNA_START=94 /DNA_END=3921 /DNA_ORIENTATION=+